jgi:anti-sigma B factor antagonist
MEPAKAGFVTADRDFNPGLETEVKVEGMNALTGSGLTVEPRRQDAAVVLSAVGDVDAASAPVLGEGLTSAIDSGAAVVVADLTQVGYIDSVGLGTLVIGLKRASERSVALRLVVTNPQIEKVLRITGLLGVFQVYGDLQTAVSDRR